MKHKSNYSIQWKKMYFVIFAFTMYIFGNFYSDVTAECLLYNRHRTYNSE